jgi:hypothetical protein
MVVWRNFSENFTEILIQKVKFHWDGQLGSVKMKFHPEWGGYLEQTAGEDFLGSDYKKSAGGDGNG